MARKNLLQDLMGQSAKPEGASSPARPDSAAYSRGAIGAVSRSIADLKSRSVIEIDPFAIKSGGLTDRLEHDEEGHAKLMESIRTYGQQVPVLVRPHPDQDGAYQIVYGRRRVMALQDLGQPVKAMVRDLDDDAVIMAQGQENAARRDLSFIEKANFARQMKDAGYERKIICDALSTDKTLISRLLNVADALPVGLIEIIGSAPSVGRDRWLELADLLQKHADVDVELAQQMLQASGAETSDARFDALVHWLSKRGTKAAEPEHAALRPPSKPQQTLKRHDGTPLATLKQSRKSVSITLPRTGEGFADWLAENLCEIHRNWENSGGGPGA
ncbi:plasmid partitioning protein RepB [Litorisediminicola beolgyonensis]|uniref:Plasmid partitioning protein RepB n=1 Tax=Litorisediminicola beolgyonensis TaxID=1173614 RepID=A0ABW3ZMG1_9RHOB